MITAHRYAWEITYGSIPEGKDVLHKCDVRSCCEPAHLFIGTNDDNVADRNRKGRSKLCGRPQNGEKNNRAKLTWEKVREIRQLYALGTETYQSLAEKCNCRFTNIAAIIKGRSWREEGA